MVEFKFLNFHQKPLSIFIFSYAFFLHNNRIIVFLENSKQFSRMFSVYIDNSYKPTISFIRKTQWKYSR